MDIRTKLKYIHEGYSIQDINSSNFKPTSFVEFLKETDDLFMESFTNDISYIAEMSMEILTESDSGFISFMNKIFKWLREKVLQFINFIKQKFSASDKKSKEIAQSVKNTINRAESNPQAKAKVEKKHPTFTIKTYKNVLHGNINFFDLGFRRVYNVISKYIDELDKYPEKNEEIISHEKIDNKEEFLKLIFNEALSINYNKEELMKKLYGEITDNNMELSELKRLYTIIEEMDKETEYFSKWSQNVLPSSLKSIETSFNKNIKITENKIQSGKAKNIDEEKEWVQFLRQSLSKIVKLINIEMELANMFHNMQISVANQFNAEVKRIEGEINSSLSSSD
jgi:hypothetical protein